MESTVDKSLYFMNCIMDIHIHKYQINNIQQNLPDIFALTFMNLDIITQTKNIMVLSMVGSIDT